MSASFPPRVGRVGEGLFVGPEVDWRGPRLYRCVLKRRGIHDYDLYDVFIQITIGAIGNKIHGILIISSSLQCKLQLLYDSMFPQFL